MNRMSRGPRWLAMILALVGACLFMTISATALWAGQTSFLKVDSPWGVRDSRDSGQPWAVRASQQSPCQTLPCAELVQQGSSENYLVLVHGDNSEAKTGARWDTLLDRLRADGRFADYSIWRFWHDTSLPIGFNGAGSSNASQLAAALESLQSADGSRRFLLLAHSRGGLVCRAYMKNVDSAGKVVSGLITLGTPHHGSPGAVPDWAALYWYQNGRPAQEFDLLFGPQALLVDTARVGSMNLAWGDADDSLGTLGAPYGNSFQFNVEIAHQGQMDLTTCDANAPAGADCGDSTVFDPNDSKASFGSLAQLNQEWPTGLNQRLITYGAYDDELSDNEDLDLWDLLGGLGEHVALAFLTNIMSGVPDPNPAHQGGGENVFHANDGMVPLQSALFSNQLQGSAPLFHLNGQAVSLDDKLQNAPLQRAAVQRIFTGEVRDHLDLLDTQSQAYWDYLLGDILTLGAGAAPPEEDGYGASSLAGTWQWQGTQRQVTSYGPQSNAKYGTVTFDGQGRLIQFVDQQMVDTWLDSWGATPQYSHTYGAGWSVAADGSISGTLNMVMKSDQVTSNGNQPVFYPTKWPVSSGGFSGPRQWSVQTQADYGSFSEEWEVSANRLD